MDKGIKSRKREIGRKGPPVVNLKDPFAHWHPRHERTMLREHFKDVPIEQIKEVAASLKLSRGTEAVPVS